MLQLGPARAGEHVPQHEHRRRGALPHISGPGCRIRVALLCKRCGCPWSQVLSGDQQHPHILGLGRALRVKVKQRIFSVVRNTVDFQRWQTLAPLFGISWDCTGRTVLLLATGKHLQAQPTEAHTWDCVLSRLPLVSLVIVAAGRRHASGLLAAPSSFDLYHRKGNWDNELELQRRNDLIN
jgi:hypothetical protein